MLELLFHDFVQFSTDDLQPLMVVHEGGYTYDIKIVKVNRASDAATTARIAIGTGAGVQNVVASTLLSGLNSENSRTLDMRQPHDVIKPGETLNMKALGLQPGFSCVLEIWGNVMQQPGK